MKNKNNTTTDSLKCRRKVLKGMLAGSAVAAPLAWKKPVIDAVLTPAHAQTSACSNLVNSSPSSVTVESLSSAPSGDFDGIEITFNGCDGLTMFAADDVDTNADRIAFFDADSSQPNVFDVEDGPASNWSLISHSFAAIPISDEAEGTHIIRVERLSGVTAGTTYDIIFNIFVPAITGGTEMTISSLRAVTIV